MQLAILACCSVIATVVLASALPDIARLVVPTTQDLDSPQCGWDAALDRLCDPDHVLSSLSVAQRLQVQLVNVEAQGHSSCTTAQAPDTHMGPQVAVALVERLTLAPGESVESAAGSLAHTVHDTWGVGHAPCNDGIVIFLTRHDRQVHFSTGAGARTVLTDDHVAAIISRMRTLLRGGDVDGALLMAVADVGTVFGIPDGQRGAAVAEAASSAKRDREGGNRHRAPSWVINAQLIVAAISAIVIVVGSSVSAWRHRRRQTAWEHARSRLMQLDAVRREVAAEAAQPQPGRGAAQASTTALDMENGGGAAGRARQRGTRPPPRGVSDSGDERDALSAGATAARDADMEAGESDEAAAAATAAAAPLPLAARVDFCPICLDPMEDATPSGLSNGKRGLGTPSAARPEKTLALPCRHRFHVRCCDEWMGTNGRRTCPICRAVAYGDDGDAGRPQLRQPRVGTIGGRTGETAGAAANYGRDTTACTASGNVDDAGLVPPVHAVDAYAHAAQRAAPPPAAYDHTLDVIFMLHAMRVRYPTGVIAPGLVDGWVRDPGRLVNVAPLAADPAFVGGEPARVAAAEAAAFRNQGGGNWGAGSFGGGSSFGGGGGGGGW